mmetsp:Transcript_17362/g.49706  ORF Transcript_17362/g.49706 Transcript_17362/m.49706 type:complete len:209 (+) Transcript_17362:298-924(+)
MPRSHTTETSSSSSRRYCWLQVPTRCTRTTEWMPRPLQKARVRRTTTVPRRNRRHRVANHPVLWRRTMMTMTMMRKLSLENNPGGEAAVEMTVAMKKVVTMAKMMMKDRWIPSERQRAAMRTTMKKMTRMTATMIREIEVTVTDAGVVAASLLLNHLILWPSCLRTAGPRGLAPFLAPAPVAPDELALDDSGVGGEAIGTPVALLPIE